MNKKLLQFASMLLMAVCLCVNFTACDDDDEDSTIGMTNGYAWVDLGLPSGLKWATCNVGAENPWEYGDYFAWGEIVPKDVYSWSTYKYVVTDDDRFLLTKYCSASYDGKNDYTDFEIFLNQEDDVAHANMGSGWRMPTTEEQQELIFNCYWEWTNNYKGKGVAGFIVYKVKNSADKGKAKLEDSAGKLNVYKLNKKNEFDSDDDYKTTLVSSYTFADMHIFFPEAACRDDWEYGRNGGGFYWSSSRWSGSSSDAYCLVFFNSLVSTVHNFMLFDVYRRYYGYSVRGVCE